MKKYIVPTVKLAVIGIVAHVFDMGFESLAIVLLVNIIYNQHNHE